MATGSVFNMSGVGSGFNTDTILQKMLDVERVPISGLQTRQAQVTQQQTAWRSVNTRLLALGTAADKLKGTDDYAQRQAVSSDPTTLTVSAIPGQDLSNVTVSVQSLAQNHQQISQGFSTLDSSVGKGSITLKVGSGSYNPIAFTSGTLEGMRDAINNAKQGVSASILDAGESAGANRYHLMLNSGTSGAVGKITATLNLSGGTAPVMTDLVAAQDAHVKLGQGASAVDVYSSTNTVSGAIPGLSLTLIAAKPDTPINISMSRNTTNLRDNVQGFLDQYNGLNDSFASNNSYNKDTQQSGVLFGDTTLLNLQTQLFNQVNSSREVGGSFNSLSAIGININDKGQLAITDTAAFEKALTKPDDVQKLFSDSTYGIAAQVRKVTDQATNSLTGSITLEDKRLGGLYDDLGTNITQTNEKVARTETRLREMFLAMETTLSQLKSQGTAMTQMLGGLSSTSSTSSTTSSTASTGG